MNWGSWDNFWMMGGYGLYVWGSYAATFVLLVAEIAMLWLRRREALSMLAMRRQNGNPSR